MRRGAIMAAALFLAMAMGGAAAVGADEAARPVVRQLTRLELRTLAYLAGLRTQEGAPLVETPLRATVVQEGGPLWVSDVLARELVADDVFEPTDGPHVVRVEVVHHGAAWALRLALFRQGWDLRTPVGGRFQIAPWVFVGGALSGALAAARVRRIGVGLLVAGVVAQLGAASLRWPEVLPRWSAMEAIGHGLLARWVVELAVRLSDHAVPIGIGIVVLCLLLVVFDHRRSPRRGGLLVASGVAGLLGGLAALEAAVHTGITGWATTSLGATALVGTLGFWAVALLLLRRRAGG